MNQLGIIHPDMLARVQLNFYPSLCTIQVGTAAQDQYGQEHPDWVNLPGHVGLHARVAPQATQERRTPNQVYVTATHHVALNGYYPAIDETMQAVIDGVIYNIEGVESDGNHKTTRLFVKLVE